MTRPAELSSTQILRGLASDGVWTPRSGPTYDIDYPEDTRPDDKDMIQGDAPWAKPGRRASGYARLESGEKLPGAPEDDSVGMSDFARNASLGADSVDIAYLAGSLDHGRNGAEPGNPFDLRNDPGRKKRLERQGKKQAWKEEESIHQKMLFTVPDVDLDCLGFGYDREDVQSQARDFFYNWSSLSRQGNDNPGIHWLTYRRQSADRPDLDQLVIRDAQNREHSISVIDFWRALHRHESDFAIQRPFNPVGSRQYLQVLNRMEIAGERAQFQGFHLDIVPPQKAEQKVKTNPDELPKTEAVAALSPERVREIAFTPDFDRLPAGTRKAAENFIRAWGRKYEGERVKPRTLTYVSADTDGGIDELVISTAKGIPARLRLETVRQILHLPENKVSLPRPIDEASSRTLLAILNAITINGESPKFDRIDVVKASEYKSAGKITVRIDNQALHPGRARPAKLFFTAWVNARPSNGDGRDIQYEIRDQGEGSDMIRLADKDGKFRFLPVAAIASALHLPDIGLMMVRPTDADQALALLHDLARLHLNGIPGGFTRLTVVDNREGRFGERTMQSINVSLPKEDA